MGTVLLYLVAFAGGHVVGALVGNSTRQLVGAFMKHEYTKRLICGLVFGGSAVAVSLNLLRLLGLAHSLPFFVALIGSFFLLAVYNYRAVRIAMKKHSENKLVSLNLDELRRTRLVQDLAAAVGALGSAIIVFM